MKTNILTLVITLVVGIILAGSLLVPVITDAQKDLGTATTITNTGYYNMGWQDSVTIELVKNGTNVDITVNGDSFVPREWGATPLILSTDVFVGAYLDQGTAISVGTRITEPDNLLLLTASTLTASASIVVEDEHLTIVKDSTTVVDVDCGKTFAYKADGEYTVVPNYQFNTMCVASDEDVIFWGAYTTGSLDCFYNTYTATAGDYTISKQITKSLREGTTDLYDVTTGTVTVSDGTDSETFTPFYGMFKTTVSGHESSGGVYSLLGVLPIMVIVAILMVAVGAIAYRRAD